MLTTDANAEETSIYQFQRWDPIDSVWVNLPTAHSANGAFNEVSDVDINLSTDRQTYTYRAGVQRMREVITQSQEATTMLLQGFSNPEESVFENNLVWTAYEGFAGGIDRYEVIRKTTLDPAVLGSPLTSTNVVQNHTDDVSDLLDTPGLFCYASWD